jgi:hypothetical protein
MGATEFTRICKFASVVKSDHLPIPLIEDRLRIKRIDLADPTLHEQKYNPLGFRFVVQSFESNNTLTKTPVRFVCYRAGGRI